MADNVLELRNVTKVFRIGGLILGTKLVAVDDVNLTMSGEKPSIVSVVGESGSGKTTLARIILQLTEPTSGDVLLGGRSIVDRRTGMKPNELRHYVQPIFQNPFESFSLRKPVDSYLFETALNLGMARDRRTAKEVVADALQSVGLSTDRVMGKYPNQFSGGELQRISIARALIPRPRLLVADEPVSMIDASLRMNIINLFLELKETYNVSIIYITHDLSTAYYVSDRIAIMYRGNLIEYGSSDEILTAPAHPYTELLMESVPKVGEKWSDDVTLPDVELKEYAMMACKFAPRCRYARDICRQERPPMVTLGEGRRALCYKPVDFQPGVDHVNEVEKVTEAG